MARLEVLKADVNRHGFPHCCITCGNDDGVEPETVTLRLGSHLVGCLALLFGPIGWLVALVVWFRTHSDELMVRTCYQCHLARLHLRNRLMFWLLCGGLPLFGAWLDYSGEEHPFMICAGLAALAWGFFQWAWLRAQFRIRPLSIGEDRLLLEVPFDDYPSIYHRHLETASLYGSADALGIDPD
ncbi:MAG: hypothetical protein AB7S38_23265 [Vulcanimicrobiota bacterium]